MADELPPLVASIIGDASDLFHTLDDVEARLADFAGQEFDAQLGVDISAVIAGIEEAEALLNQFAGLDKSAQANVSIAQAITAIDTAMAGLAVFANQDADVPLSADPAGVIAGIAAADAAAARFSDTQATTTLNVEITEALAKLTAAQTQLAAFMGAPADKTIDVSIDKVTEAIEVAEGYLISFTDQEYRAELGVDSSSVAPLIAQTEALLQQFAATQGTAEANVDITQAMDSLAAVNAELTAFVAEPADKTIDVHVTQALANVAAVESEIAALVDERSDKTVSVSVDEPGLAAAKLYIDSIAKVPTLIPLEVDQGDLVGSLAASQALLQTFAAQQYQVAINPHINEDMAIEQMADLDATLSAMGMVPIEPVIDQGRMDRILAELHVVTAQHVVDIETAAAEAKVAALEAEILTIDDLEPVVNINTSIAEAKIAALDASIASLKAEAILSDVGGGGGGSGGVLQAAGGRGGGDFLGTLLGGMFSGGGKNAIGFGTPLLPRIPVAGFGTLGALGGLGAESILGLGAGVAGFAAHGALGGAALGATSLGVTGVGLGTDLAGGGQALGDIKQYGQLQANLAQTAAVYGKSSNQYQAAMYAYQQWSSTLSKGYIQAVAAASGTETAFKTMFDKVTGDAATTGAKIINQLLQVGEKFLPTIGKFAAGNMTIIQSSLQPLLVWLQGPGLTAFNQIEQVFQDHLPTAMHAFDQAVELVIKTVAKFAPETGGVISFLDKLFTRLNGAGWNKWVGEVQRAIDAFRVWEGFIGAVGRAIEILFQRDAKTGEAFIVTLTNLINKFNDWARTVAGGDQLSKYMAAHRKEVIELVDLFGNLVAIMGSVHLQVGPALMEIVADLLKMVNVLLSIPGVDKITAYIIAFEILGRHISLLGPLLNAFNNGIKNLALGGLHLLGNALTNLGAEGGVLSKIGGWLTGVGTGGVADSMTAAATAMQGAATSMETSAARISEAFGGVGASADTMAADIVGATATSDAALATLATGAEAAGLKAEAALGTEGLAGGLTAAGGAAATASGSFTGLLVPIGLVAGATYGLDKLFAHFGGADPFTTIENGLKKLSDQTLPQATSSVNKLQSQIIKGFESGHDTVAIPLSLIPQGAGNLNDSQLTSSLQKILSNSSQLKQLTATAQDQGNPGLVKLLQQLTQLQQVQSKLKITQADYNANVQTLANATGLATPYVKTLAQELGINLKSALNPADVEAFTSYIQQNGGIAQIVGQMWTQQSENVSAALTLMAAKAQTAMPNISAAVRDMINETQPKLITLVQNLNKTGDQSGGAFVSAFIAHLTPAQLASKQMHDGVQSPLYPLEEELRQIGDNAAANMIAKFIGHKSDADSGAKGMHDALKNPLYQLQTELGATGDQAAANLIADFSKHHPEALTQAGLMHDAVTGRLSPLVTDLTTIGDTAGANLVQGLINNEVGAFNAGGALGAAIRNGLDGALGNIVSDVSHAASHVTSLIAAAAAAAKPPTPVPFAPVNTAPPPGIPTSFTTAHFITPVAATQAAPAPQVIQLVSNTVLDGRVLASNTTKYQLQAARATGNIGGRYSGGNQTGGATGTNVNNVSR